MTTQGNDWCITSKVGEGEGVCKSNFGVHLRVHENMTTAQGSKFTVANVQFATGPRTFARVKKIT